MPTRRPGTSRIPRARHPPPKIAPRPPFSPVNPSSSPLTVNVQDGKDEIDKANKHDEEHNKANTNKPTESLAPSTNDDSRHPVNDNQNVTSPGSAFQRHELPEGNGRGRKKKATTKNKTRDDDEESHSDSEREDPEIKRRRIRDRISASRARKLQHAKRLDLENQAIEFLESIKQFEKRKILLHEERQRIYDILLLHQDCGCVAIREYLAREVRAGRITFVTPKVVSTPSHQQLALPTDTSHMPGPSMPTTVFFEAGTTPAPQQNYGLETYNDPNANAITDWTLVQTNNYIDPVSTSWMGAPPSQPGSGYMGEFIGEPWANSFAFV